MDPNNSLLLLDHELYGHVMIMNHDKIIKILLLCNLSEKDMILFFNGDYIDRERKRDNINV